MPRRRHRAPARAATAAVLALALAPRLARAQGADAQPAPAVVAEARAHFERGLTLLNAQNYEGALAEFQRSYGLNPRPSVQYNIAVALQALHRYPQALRALEAYLRDVPNLPPQRRAEVERVRDQLRALIATVRVDAQPAGAQVRLDGELVGTAPLPAPLEVAPGRHVVEVVVAGAPPAREELTIASGESRDVRLTVTARPADSAGVDPTPPVRISSGQLIVRGAPAGGTIEVDGRAFAGDRETDVPVGERAIVVRAPGRATWRGSVRVGAGERREVRVHLSETSGLPPVYFGAAAGAAVVLAIAGTVTGVMTLAAADEFNRTFRDEPAINEVAERGTALRTTTNVLFVGAGIAAVGAVVLLTRTRFATAASNADIAILPGGGAAASFRLRF